MAGLTELRAEWARLQWEPLDQYWVGPGPFVERLLGIVEEQEQHIAALRAALVPFLTDTPTYGQMQIAAARDVFGVTQEEGTR